MLQQLESRSHLLLGFALLAAASACTCKGKGPTQADLGFRLDTAEVDFGRVLEGSVVSRDVTVVGTGQLDVHVAVETDPPFGVPADVLVPGGAATTFKVTFTAGATAVTGEARLSANGGMATVTLRGVGVRPKVCTPSAPCRVSTYSLEQDLCIESPAPEGSSCQPDSVCLEKGECRMGLCQGVARSCEDGDACTVDSCAMDVGCVHSARSCPPPSQLCKVAVCDPSSGCGVGDAPDLSPCGPIDCVNAHLCFAGSCMQVPTPDGFLCGPATPCQAESHCQNQQCVAPDAGVMQPKTVVRLQGAPVDERPSLLATAGNVFFQLCGLPALDGGPDAGEAGDAGPLDGGADGGDDGGVSDAGPPLASDGGFCALASYTGSGFERWTVRYGDPGARTLLQLSDQGAVLLQPGQLEVRATATGAPLTLTLPGTSVPRGIAQGTGRELWTLVAGDAGTQLLRWFDGGVVGTVTLDAGASLLAVDEQGVAWLYDPAGGALGSLQATDAGWSLAWRSAGAGLGSLASAEGAVVSGATHFLRSDDGGSRDFSWVSDAGAPLDVLARPVLLGDGAGVAFYRECFFPVSSCLEVDKNTWAYAFSLDDGHFLWKAVVLPAGAPGHIEEASLTGMQPGAVATLVQVSLDGGSQAYLQAFAGGQRVLLCPLAEGTVLGGALFTSGLLHALVTRDGGWSLETYDLASMPLLTSGWPVSDGVGGTRRAR